MLGKYNAKGKIVLFLAFMALSSALLLGFVIYQRHFNWPIDRISFDNMQAQRRVLEFLKRAGWKPKSEKVVVEKVGDDLGLARAVLLKKSNDGISVPGVLFLVGRQYILVGRLFDSQTGRDLSPDLFGRVPITFDVSRLDLNRAHKRGSTHPKVVIVEYGDYGCPSCAKLEKVWQALQHLVGEGEVVGFTRVDGQRALVGDVVHGGPLGLVAQQVLEVVVEGAGVVPGRAQPEGRIDDSLDAGEGHRLVVVGRARIHVYVGIKNSQGGLLRSGATRAV